MGLVKVCVEEGVDDVVIMLSLGYRCECGVDNVGFII